MALLDVQGLSVTYRTGDGPVLAVDDVSFALHTGEGLGLIGESGSGKSTIGKALLGVLPPGAVGAEARMVLDGQDLARLGPEAMRRKRGLVVGLIPQSAMSALDPMVRVGDLIREVLNVHRLGGARVTRAELAIAFADVGLDESFLDLYPHQFSGGMRQRACIALALRLHPKVMIADEPTTGLDVVVQKQVLQILAERVRIQGATFILITHDIGVVAEHCAKVGILYAGRLVEYGPTAQVLTRPAHPYTMGLLASTLTLADKRGHLISIPGAPPTQTARDPGCSFRHRCPFAEPVCSNTIPLMAEAGADQHAACHFAAHAAAFRTQANDPAVWDRLAP